VNQSEVPVLLHNLILLLIFHFTTYFTTVRVDTMRYLMEVDPEEVPVLLHNLDAASLLRLATYQVVCLCACVYVCVCVRLYVYIHTYIQ